MAVNLSNLSPCVEAIAQKQFKYISLFNRYAVELRKDPVKAQEAHDRVRRTWDLALKPGEKPSYPPQDPSISQKILAVWNRSRWTSDSYVKIMAAAHAINNSVILHDMRHLTEKERLQALGRLTQLAEQARASQPPDPEATLASLPFRPPPRKVQSSSMSAPLAFPGQRFSLQLLSDTMTYEICNVASNGTKGWQYTVKYEGEGDITFEEELEQQDLVEMLESSVLLDA